MVVVVFCAAGACAHHGAGRRRGLGDADLQHELGQVLGTKAVDHLVIAFLSYEVALISGPLRGECRPQRYGVLRNGAFGDTILIRFLDIWRGDLRDDAGRAQRGQGWASGRGRRGLTPDVGAATVAVGGKAVGVGGGAGDSRPRPNTKAPPTRITRRAAIPPNSRPRLMPPCPAAGMALPEAATTFVPARPASRFPKAASLSACASSVAVW